MARPPRCLVDDVDAEPVRVGAPGRHHLERVLRVRRGDLVELVDGRGGLRSVAWIPGGEPRPLASALREPPPPAPVRLAVAPPRRANLEWLIEKATELGVSELSLLDASRAREAHQLERLQRIADEALLQCRRLHRLVVSAPRPLVDILAGAGAAEIWLASPPGGAPGPGAPRRRPGAPLLVLVGPEGGFDEAEASAARAAGARPVCLADAVLRVETAALAAALAAGWSGRGDER